MIEERLILHVANQTLDLKNNFRVTWHARENLETVNGRVEQYAQLVDMLNTALVNNDVRLILAPHARQLLNLLKRARINRLPSIQEMQKDPVWTVRLGRAIHNAAPMMTRGQLQRDGLGEFRSEERIDVTSNPDLSEDLLTIGLIAHLLEQTYFVWLHQHGVEVRKDDILASLDEMARNTALTDEVSPLVEPFSALGWIKPDRIPTLMDQTQQLNMLLEARTGDKKYVRPYANKNLRMVRSREDLTPVDFDDVGMWEYSSLGTYLLGNALFNVISGYHWDPVEKQYNPTPWIQADIIATAVYNNPVEFYDATLGNDPDLQRRDRAQIYFYPKDEAGLEFRFLPFGHSNWKHTDLRLMSLGTSIKELEAIVNRAHRTVPKLSRLMD
ncbi:MAG: hypothetical protein WC775_05735 [Patescibacteria group bacterium]|jgi:hypothetical protein